MATTQTITEVEKANYEFDQTVAEQNELSYMLRGQIGEIEQLMRMLQSEVAAQAATKQKVEFVVQKEQQMQQRKDQDEAKLVQTLMGDIQQQSSWLNQ